MYKYVYLLYSYTQYMVAKLFSLNNTYAKLCTDIVNLGVGVVGYSMQLLVQNKIS